MCNDHNSNFVSTFILLFTRKQRTQWERERERKRDENASQKNEQKRANALVFAIQLIITFVVLVFVVFFCISKQQRQQQQKSATCSFYCFCFVVVDANSAFVGTQQRKSGSLRDNREITMPQRVRYHFIRFYAKTMRRNFRRRHHRQRQKSELAGLQF